MFQWFKTSIILSKQFFFSRAAILHHCLVIIQEKIQCKRDHFAHHSNLNWPECSAARHVMIYITGDSFFLSFRNFHWLAFNMQLLMLVKPTWKTAGEKKAEYINGPSVGQFWKASWKTEEIINLAVDVVRWGQVASLKKKRNYTTSSQHNSWNYKWTSQIDEV